MGSGTRRREALLALLLCAVPAVLAEDGVWAKSLPVGCFNYGFTYHPAMTNVTGMPFTTLSSMQCQARCQTTPGCAYFGYFATNQLCWLGGKDAILAEATVSQGVVSGPAFCPEEIPACSAIPGAGFPGKTPDESRAAWAGGVQPVNLQCWPRKENGFPATCGNKTAVVLEDTETGWPGRCKGLMEVKLTPEETCQSRCFLSPLCGVWALENKTSGVPKCWHGLVGENCFDPSDGLEPMRAQLVMHGGFRVLMNTMNMKIHNLTKIFDVSTFKDWKDGANACRKSCLSFLMCQHWQYSDVYGCFIEHAAVARVAWPLVNNGVNMETGTAVAATIRAGEYIQHDCPKGPWTPLPLDKVPEVQAPISLPHLPLADVVKGPAADLSASTGFPVWGILLTLVVVLLGVAVIGAAVWMSMADARKGARGRTTRGVAMPEELSFQGAAAPFESAYQPQPAPFQSSPTYTGSSPTYAGAQGDSFSSQTPLTQNAMDQGAWQGHGGWGGDGYYQMPMQQMPQQPMPQWPGPQQYQDPRYGGVPTTVNMQYQGTAPPSAPLTPNGSYAPGYPQGYPQGAQGYPQGWSH